MRTLHLVDISSKIMMYLCNSVINVVIYQDVLQVIKMLYKHKHDRDFALLQEFLQLSEKFSASTRLSIRLVQEIEVVSRGYTL